MILSTARKLAIARGIASTLFAVGVSPRQTARRRGVLFDLDLEEGIDLSLFVLGSFQREVVDLIRRLVPVDGIVLDVGANIGAMTLPVARHLTRGRVHAVEPTGFAADKLERNLALNPDLEARVTVTRTFLAGTSSPRSDLVAYSSWPVRAGGVGQHPVHGGIPKEAACGQLTVDDLLARLEAERLSLVKIDTDGHEFGVLSGASRCLATMRPYVVFEATAYLMEAPYPTFDRFRDLFAEHRYTIRDPRRLEPVDERRFRATCPAGGSLDLVAVPDERLDR